MNKYFYNLIVEKRKKMIPQFILELLTANGSFHFYKIAAVSDNRIPIYRSKDLPER